MTNATFVMEQHLGHLTYYQNLRQHIEPVVGLHTRWVPVTYARPNAVWERVKALPPGLRGSLNGRAQVREGLAAAPSDVVFFNTQVPAALGGSLTKRVPYVIATDLTPLQYDAMSLQYNHTPDRQGLVKSYKHHINTALLRGAAKLLPWSSWVRGSMIADYGVDPARIEVVPPGVDLERWAPALKQAEGPMRLLFVGGDLERKGGRTLIEAFRALPDGMAELILVTRSQTPQQPGIRSYHGLQPNNPELMALYREADVFVLPSEAEAFGIAAVEASASGLPVIATTIGGLADIIIDGENGFAVPPRDVQTLVERLRHLASDPLLRNRLGQAGRARAERLFDTRKNASRIAGHVIEAAQVRGEVGHAA